ncbi:Phenol hydroxylase P1 protein [Cupriavidus necator]|uniref:Phenol hydroxylase n=1 Tax=Cupriavidus necator (strain ATCC 17699 / DSM 428 / KCTC 22496 / NCIMB 10442 / H16 / Stanier 337) TaxID=381666 RepID=Q0K3T7_CUPNH|nr:MULTISPECIES: aromatic/alkene monooxygenase hydroxylase subunit beta [Cupriavidus]EON20378.1 phenol hydroxylase P1 protein [Cupriavidus sp. GA3-3]KUE85707.1 phenol hydroxylase [Cupriavidus necator]QCC03248.1 phenol hydroxylase [Cupriavidus necator H16]QQB80305.1 aromatic/alkene monooxygenase hydroxylase subunit beta [Cupriavidus necator]WKA44579.1 aromatic/alkene monooxygenase hydroxylase subunit beta [Cupriavidus necator]
MQVDIKTQQIQPLRQTYGHVARRFGDKPASRYQEATYDVQSEVNFHYRPTWDPGFELYDKRRTAIVMQDWYALKDPRQFYYGAYVTARGRQQDATEKSFAFVEKRGLLQALPAEWQERLAVGLLPLRHVEWGANMNNFYCADYGWGTAITQACTYCAMDRLGIAQYLSRIGMLLDGNTGVALERARVAWLESAAWQPLRRFVEHTFVTGDWFETFVAQNLVLDGLLYPLVYQHADAVIARACGTGLAVLTEFMNDWRDEHARWVDAVIQAAAAESDANRALLSGWARAACAEVAQALVPVADALTGEDGAQMVALCREQFEVRLGRLGLAA